MCQTFSEQYTLNKIPNFFLCSIELREIEEGVFLNSVSARSDWRDASIYVAFN